MTKADLMKLVGKRVFVCLKGEEKGRYGTLWYDYRKPNYFYIDDLSFKFKASYIRKLIESEESD